MKMIRYEVILVMVILFSCILLGAGDIAVYFGTVRNIQDNRMMLIMKNGSEKSVKLNNDTRVFASGRLVPYTRIKPNSHVQAAVNGDGLCLQLVVEEGPK